jgi:hypothetical protein
MTFTVDVPISGDTLGSTRDRIRANFQETAAVMAINHVAFNQLGKGKHIYLQMPEVAASGAGVPVTLANEIGFYSKNGTNPVEPNLWFRGQTNGYEYQLTNANQANNATFGTFTNYPPVVVNQNGGWTFLPGGLLLQYGIMVSTGSSTTVTFPVAFSTLDTVVTVTRNSTTGSAGGVGNVQLATFVFLRGGATNTTFYWQAIGKA